MKGLLSFLVGLNLLLIPQLGAIANEVKPEIINRENKQSLSRAGYYQTWTRRGNEAFRSGNYDRAIALYDQAIAINAKQPLAWEKRGDALAKQGQYQPAIEAYNEALNLSNQKPVQLQQKISVIREKRAQQLR